MSAPRPRPPLPAGVDGYQIDGRRLGGAVVWQTPRMAEALAQRDVRGVFSALQSAGVSQRKLAAACGIGQSEVSEIVRGRRTVRSVDVLQRVSDGLGLPRGAMGLAHQDPPTLSGDVSAAVAAVLAACTTLIGLLTTMEGRS